MPQPEENRVRLCGVLADIRQRWTPDGSLAVIASLILPRPSLGADRATSEPSQPIPLRATGVEAGKLAGHEGRTMAIEGKLRRRYYHRQGESHWGQVEVWVDQCHLSPDQPD